MKLEITLNQNDAGKRVVDVIGMRYPLSGRMRKWLRFHSAAAIDGMRVQLQDLVGASARLLTLETKEPDIKVSGSPKLDVVWEDPFFFIVNKPHGLPVHPASKREEDSLLSRVKNAVGAQVVYPIGRLDRDVTGLMLFAKNPLMASWLSRQREDGRLKKTYQALCHGHWKQTAGIIEERIGPLAEYNRYGVMENGLPALTRYHVLENGQDFSWVEVQIETGRTHQIRVHLDSMGHPILGDPYYGRADGVSVLQLYAVRLELIHPITKQAVLVEISPEMEPFAAQIDQKPDMDSAGGFCDAVCFVDGLMYNERD